ncbi:response regulator [Lysinibacillus antri]|uniref:Circadian input-output histidine kinase CikA n=1 Tax=Lysinibacillus antri TaxID=2498145 RepID=A0A3S0RUT4_9BACI|nr:response regulator [Lysinibacillus antri]RUL50902.1 response regulator [Lysinibacillus antri]
MKIRTRLLIALSTLPLFFFFVIGSGWLQISHINNSSEEIKLKFDSSTLAGQIRADIKDEGIILRNLIIYDDEAALKAELRALQTERENVHTNILLLEQNIQSPEQKALVDTLKTTNSEFENYTDQITSFISENRIEEARNLMDENSKSIHEEFTIVLRNITNGFDTQLESSLFSLVDNVRKEIVIAGFILAFGIILVTFICMKNILSIFKRMTAMTDVMKSISNGHTNLGTKVEVISNDEFDAIATSFNQMTDTLDIQMNKEKELTWKKSNINDITTHLTGKLEIPMFGQTLLSKLVPLVKSSHALFYVKDMHTNSNQLFKHVSSYASNEKLAKQSIKLGEGLIGQAIIEKKMLHITNVPSTHIILSGLGESKPLNLIVLPITFEGEVNAVIELASFHPFDENQLSFLEELSDNLGIVLESVLSRNQLAMLLEESQTLMEEVQAQSEELQNQQEELRATNEELEEQTQALRQSELKLQLQQVELEQTNAELEEKAKRLEEQNLKYEEANRIVKKAKAELEVKAEQLALSSKYKSEFLANMSHELRTPLNSLIILSKLLADNSNRNLTEKQVEYAKTIYSSGNDLLILINNILDLAKIESGKTEIIPGNIEIQNIVEFVQSNFNVIADNQNLLLNIHVLDGTPPTLYSDEVRIQQVLKNLLSNAFKFTDEGEVRLEIKPKQHPTEQGKLTLAFSVIDTGIGISKDKLNLIFEAFQQADGTTSRKYGGTGLGLSISRELATLLGGKIVVESEEGKGSTFTFYVGNYEAQPQEIITPVELTQVEAAVTFVEQTQENNKLRMAQDIQSISTTNSHIKRILIVDDDFNQRNSLMELIGNMDFVIKAVSTGIEARNLLKLERFDCLILDLGLTDTSGFHLLTEIKNNPIHSDLKVFVYTGRDLSVKEELELNKFAHTIIIKNERSPARLVAELELYLSDSNNRSVEESFFVNKKIDSNSDLVGKKILLVDDDVRNVFALSSVLEMAGLTVLFAYNGIESIHLLEQHSDIDLVLMDIMMPEMDGYEAISRIRLMPQYTQLPIIALTAKAMKEDHEKCLAIGASDYIAKPVEPDQLISIMKVWLY